MTRGKVIKGIAGFIYNDNGSGIIGVKKINRYKAVLKFLIVNHNNPRNKKENIIMTSGLNDNIINSLTR